MDELIFKSIQFFASLGNKFNFIHMYDNRFTLTKKHFYDNQIKFA
jgi:hypothetical protein